MLDHPCRGESHPPLRAVTNAAGSLNPAHQPGSIVLLADHINLSGLCGSSPLVGPNEDSFGPRFLALSDAYDLHLRRTAHEAWSEIADSGSDGSISAQVIPALGEGVYAYVAGPSYETRAEARMLRMLGADLVGMSTVPEVLVARHAGIRVLAASLVTNSVVMEPGLVGSAPRLVGASRESINELAAKGKASHEEVIEMGDRGAEMMQVSCIDTDFPNPGVKVFAVANGFSEVYSANRGKADHQIARGLKNATRAFCASPNYSVMTFLLCETGRHPLVRGIHQLVRLSTYACLRSERNQL